MSITHVSDAIASVQTFTFTYTTLVPSLGLRTEPACEAGLSTGMRRERVPPHRRKKERNLCLKIEDGSFKMVLRLEQP